MQANDVLLPRASAHQENSNSAVWKYRVNLELVLWHAAALRAMQGARLAFVLVFKFLAFNEPPLAMQTGKRFTRFPLRLSIS
jgi:hypothetical protein